MAYVEKRRADFAHEHGLMDPETGAWEYGRGDSGELKRQYDCDLAEIADGLRALGPNVRGNAHLTAAQEVEDEQE